MAKKKKEEFKSWIITRKEIWYVTYCVEAETKEEALNLVDNEEGNCEPHFEEFHDLANSKSEWEVLAND